MRAFYKRLPVTENHFWLLHYAIRLPDEVKYASYKLSEEEKLLNHKLVSKHLLCYLKNQKRRRNQINDEAFIDHLKHGDWLTRYQVFFEIPSKPWTPVSTASIRWWTMKKKMIKIFKSYYHRVAPLVQAACRFWKIFGVAGTFYKNLEKKSKFLHVLQIDCSM